MVLQNVNAVSVLLSCGSDPRIRDKHGDSAITLAEHFNQCHCSKEIKKLLLEERAAILIQTQWRLFTAKKAIHHEAQTGHTFKK